MAWTFKITALTLVVLVILALLGKIYTTIQKQTGKIRTLFLLYNYIEITFLIFQHICNRGGLGMRDQAGVLKVS